MDWSYKCVDYQCEAKPGKVHNHELVSQEMLEFAVIRSECLLRILSHCPNETIIQSIEFVRSTWPHPISFTTSLLKSKFSQFFIHYQSRAKKDEGFVRAFLDRFDEEVAHFRQVVLTFRSSTALPGQFFFNFCNNIIT